MANSKLLCVLCVAAVWLSSSCDSQQGKGIDARYALEKKVWEIRMIEQRIWQNPLSVEFGDLDAAIEAYENILATTSLESPQARAWNQGIRNDIGRLRLSCTSSLARLCLIRLQENAGVTYFRSGLRRNDLLFRERRDLGVSLALSMYARIAKDPFEDRCAALIEDLAGDQLLWRGGVEIGDTLLSIPVYLVRVEVENSGAGRPLDRVEPAEKFIGLVVETWPDSLAGLKARLARADLYAILGRYEEALSDIDGVLLRSNLEANRNETLLFRAEVLGHGLNRFAEAESLLTVIRDAGPSTPISRAAALDLAALRIKAGHVEEGTRALLELELAGDTPAETKAAAMLLRAICLLDQGDWPESLHVLWRICRLLPFTRASMVAPLIILRRELATEGTQRALEVQGKVAEFYLSAIERGSTSWRYRHLVQDCLIESYLIVNDPRGAAAVLEDRAPKWNDDAGSVGLFKSALIYLQLLGDRENGVRMLKKSLDAFPQSRYSKIVRGHLETASHRKAVD